MIQLQVSVRVTKATSRGAAIICVIVEPISAVIQPRLYAVGLDVCSDADLILCFGKSRWAVAVQDRGELISPGAAICSSDTVLFLTRRDR